MLKKKKKDFWDFLGGPVTKACVPNAGVLSSIPCARTKSLYAAMKTW